MNFILNGQNMITIDLHISTMYNIFFLILSQYNYTLSS